MQVFIWLLHALNDVHGDGYGVHGGVAKNDGNW